MIELPRRQAIELHTMQRPRVVLRDKELAEHYGPPGGSEREFERILEEYGLVGSGAGEAPEAKK